MTNQHLSYVTSEDVCACFEGDTLLAIQAPQGTQLEVPIPTLSPASKRSYQIHLKSSEGQIYVLLVNKESTDSEAVMVQVPLPQQVSQAMEEQEQEQEQQQEQQSQQQDSSATGDAAKPASTVRRSGRGKVKATSPPEIIPPAKKAKQDQLNSDEAAAKEVASILGGGGTGSGGPLSSEIPGLEDLISTESKIHEHDSASLLSRFDNLLLTCPLVFGPLMRLSPPPSEKDYCFNLDDSEGVCDLFDVL